MSATRIDRGLLLMPETSIASSYEQTVCNSEANFGARQSAGIGV